MDSRFQVLDSGLFVSKTWIPDSEFRIPITNGIPESLSCIPYSTSKISNIQESGSPLHGRYCNMIVNTELIIGRDLSRFTLRLQHPVKRGCGLYRPGSKENFKQIDPFTSNYHPNPQVSALEPVYTNPDIFFKPLTFLHELGLPSTSIQWKPLFRMAKYPVHTNSSKQMYRFKNVWIRVNEALVIRNAGTVYRTIFASQWYIMTA